MGKGSQDTGKRGNFDEEPSNEENFPAWAKDVKECEEKYGVNRDFGLSVGEVEKRREIYGYNELEKHEGTSIFQLISEQFNDTLVRILLVAAIVSFVLAWYDGEEGGEMGITAFVEPLVIFLILIVNAIVGIWQESNAEKALEALKEIQSEQATVTRDGEKIPSLPAKELVPGDIVDLRVGDKVPADMRVLSLISSTVRVEQGSLTGESEAVSKTVKTVPENSDIQGKKCMVFAGTTLVNGNCICLVTHTGMNTEIGKVHSQIHEASQSEEDTPLKQKLNEFGEVLTMIIGVICALVWLINVKYFLTWEYVDGWPRNFKFSFEKCTYYFEIAVALAVAAIPEGLPAVITTCLALGTRKMAQKNALVRKLPSVETLGCTTVICSDKTGTLTTNQMSVTKLVAVGSRAGTLRSFNVEGTTYNPSDGKIDGWPVGRMDANLQTIAKIASVCNDAGVEQSGSHYVANGMPTEAALKVLVEKMGFPEGANNGSSSSHKDVLRCCQLWSTLEQRFATLEFDRDRKSMGVLVKSSSGNKTLLVKGAVENLLERCSFIQLLDGSVVELDQHSRDLILHRLREMSTTALRCLGFAYKDDLETLEYALFQQCYIESSLKKARDLEKSNAALRNELSEAKAASEDSKKKLLAAENEVAASKAQLEATHSELEAEKGRNKELEDQNVDLQDRLEGVAIEASIKDRCRLMKEFLSGGHSSWNPGKWIALGEKLEAGLSLSVEEAEVEGGQEVSSKEAAGGSNVEAFGMTDVAEEATRSPATEAVGEVGHAIIPVDPTGPVDRPVD